ncbi:hypothetical protein FRC07_014445 [Ceratobasidium sp. 392]|nr:hypothetical protein FRC07_014445 [Ceratobasidium sp. 392]
MADRSGRRPKLFRGFPRTSKPSTPLTQGASTSAAASVGGQSSPAPLHPCSTPPTTYLLNPSISNYWSGLRKLLNLLINGCVVFEPLQQAAEGLLSLAETFEREAENREDYRMLRIKLDKLFHSLAGFLGASTSNAMTSAIADLARGIDRELGLIRQRQEQTRINSHMHAEVDADEVLKHYRVIQGLLDDFMLNASMNMWQTIDEQAAVRSEVVVKQES